MADKIHKQKKDWPHFDKLHLGSKEYAEGWERIFGSKNEEASGVQKRSKKDRSKTRGEYEESGRNSGKRHSKSKRQGKKTQP